MFSWLKNTLNHVTTAISHGIKAIGHATPKVFKALVNAGKTAAVFTSKQVATVYSDIKAGASKLEQDAVGIVHGGQGLIGSLGSSFAMPIGLAIGAIGIAYVALK